MNKTQKIDALSLLDKYKVTELKTFAKNLELKGYSKLKKAEIAELIVNEAPNLDITNSDIPQEVKDVLSQNSDGKTVAAKENSTSEKTAKEKSEKKPAKEDVPVKEQKNKKKFSLKDKHLNLVDAVAAPHVNNIKTQSRGEAILELKQYGVKVKVYPNEPCPCGSGRKFKKCCASKNIY